MPIILKPDIDRTALDAEIGRLIDLLRDLELIRGGTAPDDGELAHAPVLENWRAAVRGVACLAGRPSSHPHLSGDRDAVTSPLWVLDPVRGYARTESRFWRLATPAGVRFDTGARLDG